MAGVFLASSCFLLIFIFHFSSETEKKAAFDFFQQESAPTKPTVGLHENNKIFQQQAFISQEQVDLLESQLTCDWYFAISQLQKSIQATGHQFSEFLLSSSDKASDKRSFTFKIQSNWFELRKLLAEMAGNLPCLQIQKIEANVSPNGFLEVLIQAKWPADLAPANQWPTSIQPVAADSTFNPVGSIEFEKILIGNEIAASKNLPEIHIPSNLPFEKMQLAGLIESHPFVALIEAEGKIYKVRQGDLIGAFNAQADTFDADGLHISNAAQKGTHPHHIVFTIPWKK